MVETILILAVMFGGNIPESTHEVATAIDDWCDDISCQIDAIAVCWNESRCKITGCNKSGACGPWQQKAKYADALDGTIKDRRKDLSTDVNLAMFQFLSKRDKYKQRYGTNWIRRYAGGSKDHKDRNHKKYKQRVRWVNQIIRGLRNG